MDKHWKDVKVGDIIEVIHQYYKLCEGEFEIEDYATKRISKFYGKHFIFLPKLGCSKDYDVEGFDLLEESYKIVNELPENLYK